jgi:hypothetical protein
LRRATFITGLSAYVTFCEGRELSQSHMYIFVDHPLLHHTYMLDPICVIAYTVPSSQPITGYSVAVENN